MKNNKTGRNDPCPCGSGKKYKKCCLSKDEENRVIDQRKPFQAQEDQEDKEDEECDEGYFPWEGNETAREDMPAPVDDPLPPLSAPDQKIVDDWWAVTRPAYKAQDAQEMMRLVVEFLDAHPDLFEHLYLHEEFMFEFGAYLARRGRHAQHAELLMRLRREQPGMYVRCFGYYDQDLIAELVVQNRRAEIPEYFDYFLKYPYEDSGHCAEVIELLAWKGWTSELFALVSATDEWRMRRAFQPYLVAPDLSSDAADKIFSEFQSWAYRPKITRDQIAERLQRVHHAPSEEVFTKGYRRKWCDYRRLRGVFLRFLQNDRGLPWTTAEFLADRLSTFWLGYGQYKLCGDALYPTPENIEKYLACACRKFFSYDSVKLVGTLQALVFFGSLLRQKEIFTDAQEKSWDAGIAELYEKGRPCMHATECAYRIYPSYESLSLK